MTRNATHDPATTLLALTAIATDFPASASALLYPPVRQDLPHPSPILTEPPTPSSSATVRRRISSLQYLDEDDDEVHMSRARSSSRTYRWIEDQQFYPSAAEDVRAGPPHAARPQMSMPTLLKNDRYDPGPAGLNKHHGDTNHRASRARDANDAVAQEATTRADTPSQPSTPRKARNSHGLFSAPSPLRSLHLAFSARRPSALVARAHSPAASSTSTFRRHPERAASHSRGSSLSATGGATPASAAPRARAVVPEVAVTPPAATKPTSAWKRKRPSIAGPFGSSRAPEEDGESSEGSSPHHPPPRPSTSSSVTQQSGTTAAARTSTDAAAAAPAARKVYFGSIRSHSSTTIFSASPSLWSLPTDASHINDPPESTKVLARGAAAEQQGGSGGAPVTWKPSTPAHFGTVTSMLASPRARRKRKLIISGIPPHDERRFEGVRKWCESFGELSSITRVANGDLHIDFRKAEVADTVCRLNARVYIHGVGSVCLSWFTGKRP